ncbi:MAG: hypothetical protein WCP52_05600 [Bacteroidota bacterium]
MWWNYFSKLLLSCVVLLAIDSCSCDCACTRNLGCKILTVKRNSNSSVIITKMYCSQTITNFAADKAIQDSVSKFTAKYQTDSTTVFVRDSVYKNERYDKLKCKETSGYENNGFSCDCAK